MSSSWRSIPSRVEWILSSSASSSAIRCSDWASTVKIVTADPFVSARDHPIHGQGGTTALSAGTTSVALPSAARRVGRDVLAQLRRQSEHEVLFGEPLLGRRRESPRDEEVEHALHEFVRH